MLLEEGISEQPYTVVIPGQSRTTSYANAYAVGRSAYGYGTSYTTHSPGYAVSGVSRLPHAGGLVFRFVPGFGELRARMDRLPDDLLKPIVEKWKNAAGDERPFIAVKAELEMLIEKANDGSR